jgi:hypothetical protein
MLIITEGTGMSSSIERMRLQELGCAVVLLVILAAVFLPALHRPWEERRPHASCQNNLKQMGLVFRMYANESVGGLFPPMMVADVPLVDCDATPPTKTAKRGMLVAAPSIRAIYPEYVTDPRIVLCPTDSISSKKDFTSLWYGSYFHEYCSQARRGARAAGNSYAYTGYAYLVGENGEQEAAQLKAVLGPVVEAAGRGEWAKAEGLVQEDIFRTADNTPAQRGEAEVISIARAC